MHATDQSQVCVCGRVCVMVWGEGMTQSCTGFASNKEINILYLM